MGFSMVAVLALRILANTLDNDGGHGSSFSLQTMTAFTGAQLACRRSCGQGGGVGDFCLGRWQKVDFSWGLA